MRLITFEDPTVPTGPSRRMVNTSMPVELTEPNAQKSQPAHTDERNDPPKPCPGEPDGGTLRERRREPRYPCNDHAELRRLFDGERFPVTVLDVSRSGIGVALSTALLRGSRVEILLPRQIVIFGEVRHCRRSGDGFQAGILIEEVFYSLRIGNGHVHAEQLTSYLGGKGLSMREAVEVGQHLRMCRLCDTKAKTQNRLEPARSF